MKSIIATTQSIKSRATTNSLPINRILAVSVFCLLLPEMAFAMPWDGPLAQFVGNLTGNVAPAVATIVFVVIGLLVAFGEVNGILGTMLRVAFGLSFALMAVTWVGIFS